MTAQYTYLMDTGTVSIDTSDLLGDVEGEWIAAFGSTLDLDASTPQGTMIASETVARASVMKNNADLANTINPNISYGVFLDAICALLGVGRGTNQSTIAQSVKITGNPATTIQAGSRVQTVDGDIFSLINVVTIPPSGNILADFQSQDYGVIPVPLGQLNIIDGTIGWGSAEATANDTIVTPGSNKYTDPQLKNARNRQLASQGTASTAAILANVLKVPNVTSAQVVENNTGAAGVVNGVTFTKPNAIWVCVAGTPAAASVAAALYKAHNGGCPWDYGTDSGVPVNAPDGVITTDDYTGLPYHVKWVTPVMYDAYVHITIRQSSAESPGASAIQKCIVDYANGLDQGEAGFVVSASVSAFEVAGAVARKYPGLYIKDCDVACVLAGAAAPVFPAGFVNEFVMPQFGQAKVQIGNITVEFV